MQEQLELNEVLELRPNNKQLKDYIHSKYKKAVTLKDIQNMKLSLRKAKASGRRDEQILLDTKSYQILMKVPGKSLLRRCKVFCLCRLPDTGDATCDLAT